MQGASAEERLGLLFTLVYTVFCNCFDIVLPFNNCASVTLTACGGKLKVEQKSCVGRLDV